MTRVFTHKNFYKRLYTIIKEFMTTPIHIRINPFFVGGALYAITLVATSWGFGHIAFLYGFYWILASFPTIFIVSMFFSAVFTAIRKHLDDPDCEFED